MPPRHNRTHNRGDGLQRTFIAESQGNPIPPIATKLVARMRRDGEGGLPAYW
jgi:hypothetical protein